MAGLACGEASPLAWRFLQPAVEFFQTVSDDAATRAMRMLAQGSAGDVPLVAGESGAACLAGLLALARDPAQRQQAGLDAASRVLLFNTEGATAPALYASLAGVEAPEACGRSAIGCAAGAPDQATDCQARAAGRVRMRGFVGDSPQGTRNARAPLCSLTWAPADPGGPAPLHHAR